MPDPDVSLRNVRETDLESLRRLRSDVDLQRQLMAYPGDLSDFDGWLERRKKDLLFRVVSRGADTSCVGYVQLSRHHQRDRYAYLGIAIDPHAQSQGLGRRALRQLIAESRLAGLRKLLLEVRADNAKAIGLYRSEGFEDVGVMKSHYDAGSDLLDVLVMERPV